VSSAYASVTSNTVGLGYVVRIGYAVGVGDFGFLKKNQFFFFEFFDIPLMTLK
jgi:hypothetical protein